jgi:hypothetical protein
MTWIEAAKGPFERLLEAEVEMGREAVRARLEGLRLAYLDLRMAGGDRPLAEGPNAGRTKGPWVLWMLRKTLSPPAFRPVQDVWLRGGALETATLREVAERTARTDLGPFFDFWVYGAHLPEYRLRRAEVKREGETHAVTLQVENSGTGAYPAPVVVETEEGARHVFRAVAAPGARTELRCALVTKPTRAAVDPEADVLMETGARAWLPVQARKRWIFG